MNKMEKAALGVLRQLEKELGAEKPFELWCKNKGIPIFKLQGGDYYIGLKGKGYKIPSTVLYEVFGE